MLSMKAEVVGGRKQLWHLCKIAVVTFFSRCPSVCVRVYKCVYLRKRLSLLTDFCLYFSFVIFCVEDNVWGDHAHVGNGKLIAKYT